MSWSGITFLAITDPSIEQARLFRGLDRFDPATTAVEKVAIQYGAFINTLIQFFIVAMVVFLLVKVVNGIRRQDAEQPAPSAPPAPTPEEKLLTEIRDLLAKPKA